MIPKVTSLNLIICYIKNKISYIIHRCLKIIIYDRIKAGMALVAILIGNDGFYTAFDGHKGHPYILLSSKAVFNLKTFTLGSPKTPRSRPSVSRPISAIIAPFLAESSPRALATRST